MATITTGSTSGVVNLQSDISNAMIDRYMVSKLLRLADKETIFYKLGKKISVPKGESQTITFTRWERLQTPRTALSEGVTPTGVTLAVSRISAILAQWGSFCTISDVAEMTVRYQPFQRAVELVGMQAAETLDREIQKVLLASTNVFYPNGKTSRASLTSADVLDDTLQRKMRAQLKHNGAPGVMGGDKRKVFMGIVDSFVAQDIMKDTQFIEAAKFQDLQPLTSGELGQWLGVRWQECNNIPVYERSTEAVPTTVDGVALTTGETALTDGDYGVAITAIDNQGYERFFQVLDHGATAATAGYTVAIATTADAVRVVLPTITAATDSGVANAYSGHGFDPGAVAYNIYMTGVGGTTFYLQNTSGPIQGGTYHIASATTITDGTSIVAKTTGTTLPVQPPSDGKVHNWFVFGDEWYQVAELEGVKVMMTPSGAQKGDELAQRRSVGWKFFCKALITNENFGIRGESRSNFDA